MGPQQGRILHAHFDGKELAVRCSKLYDFRHQDNETLKPFAQWSLCRPVGETRK